VRGLEVERLGAAIEQREVRPDPDDRTLERLRRRGHPLPAAVGGAGNAVAGAVAPDVVEEEVGDPLVGRRVEQVLGDDGERVHAAGEAGQDCVAAALGTVPAVPRENGDGGEAGDGAREDRLHRLPRSPGEPVGEGTVDRERAAPGHRGGEERHQGRVGR
jgi:hypothetical protein